METKLENIAKKFTEVIIGKLESIQKDWSKPWIYTHLVPQNFNGRRYSGINRLFLSFFCELKNFKVPVFITYKQAKSQGISILKGEKAFLVYFAAYVYVHQDTNVSISQADYLALSKEEQNEYYKKFLRTFHNVFNIEQTDFSSKFPERWETMLKNFEIKAAVNNVDVENEILNNMLFAQNWLCPISLAYRDSAFYNIIDDEICLPEKKQFINSESFYSTLLHEMSHSTGAEKRLNRIAPCNFGDTDYAREELVAELSSAIAGVLLNVSVTIRQENIAYLKNWLAALKETPEFLMNVIIDVARTVSLILETLNISIDEIDKKVA